MRKAYTLLRRAGSVLRRLKSKITIVRQYAERFGNPRRISSGKRTQNAAWHRLGGWRLFSAAVTWALTLLSCHAILLSREALREALIREIW